MNTSTAAKYRMMSGKAMTEVSCSTAPSKPDKTSKAAEQ